MDRTQEAFADFHQTAITDGGYLGRMQAVENQEIYIKTKLRTELKAVNTRLKAAKVCVYIRKSGNCLQLRST
ncbi:MAG: integrase, partial [Dolichospermum sp.]